jgi:hypothetical protein
VRPLKGAHTNILQFNNFNKNEFNQALDYILPSSKEELTDYLNLKYISDDDEMRWMSCKMLVEAVTIIQQLENLYRKKNGLSRLDIAKILYKYNLYVILPYEFEEDIYGRVKRMKFLFFYTGTWEDIKEDYIPKPLDEKDYIVGPIPKLKKFEDDEYYEEPIQELVESEISTEPIDKHIIIRKKMKLGKPGPKRASSDGPKSFTKKINYEDYNTNLFVDNWLDASEYSNLKSLFPKDYDNILNHFINQAKYNKRIFPATIFKVLNKDLISRLKNKYSLQEMYEGAENLSIAILEDDRIKVKDEGISDDFKNIQQYI